MIRNLIVVLLVNVIFYTSAFACSSFQLKATDTSYVGKNYDWTFGDALIVFNPSHLQKSSLTFSATQKKLQWTSQYSSVTFNQYGLDFPNGGMNETGLTIEVLWLDSSVYAKPDDKAVLNELQWIQYALDTQSTVDGVIRSLDNIRIDPVYAKVHYFVCDLNKNCTTIEFVNGKVVFGSYDTAKAEVITNSTLLDSAKYLSNFKNFGGTKDIIWSGYNSLDRFARINDKIRTYIPYGFIDPVTYTFSTLNTVKRKKTEGGTYTQWQIVHNKNNLTTHFKTAFANDDLGTVELKDFTNDCNTRYYFDLENKARGNINNDFQPLTYDVNHAHVKKTLRKIMPTAPDKMVKAIASAPFQFKCVP